MLELDEKTGGQLKSVGFIQFIHDEHLYRIS